MSRAAVNAVVLFGAPLLTAVIGGIASASAPVFYSALVQPSWAPPSWVFGPVWTVLYLLMGLAAFLVWRTKGWSGTLTLFLLHLIVNGAWSWLFFASRSGTGSRVDIVLLWAMIVALIIGFWRARPLAGALLLPYLAWVMFATALNFAIVALNRGVFR
jgi:translocator protein